MASSEPPKHLVPPVENGPFLVPAPGATSEPGWGLKAGIAVGLWPTSGPRGLFRIYAPYVGHPPRKMINFVAVEPIVGGRGFSELEPSRRDGMPGKAMWSGNAMESTPSPRDPWVHPAAGRIDEMAGARRLTVFVHVERFDNGAQPVIEMTLREDRPHEVGFRVFTAELGAEMESCILTATMGSYARLRRLWLEDRVIGAPGLWDDFQQGQDFAPHQHWGLDRMLVLDGEAIVAMTTDETKPTEADYARDVPPSWRYEGRKATQYWRAPAEESLAVQVNGRATYWATAAAIPGGIAFENFELVAPFRPGQSCTFGVTAEGPEALGFDAIPPDFMAERR